MEQNDCKLKDYPKSKLWCKRKTKTRENTIFHPKRWFTSSNLWVVPVSQVLGSRGSQTKNLHFQRLPGEKVTTQRLPRKSQRQVHSQSKCSLQRKLFLVRILKSRNPKDPMDCSFKSNWNSMVESKHITEPKMTQIKQTPIKVPLLGSFVLHKKSHHILIFTTVFSNCFMLKQQNLWGNWIEHLFQGTFSQCRSTPLENSRPLLRNYDFNHPLFLRLAFVKGPLFPGGPFGASHETTSTSVSGTGSPTLKDNHQGPADSQKLPASLRCWACGVGVGAFGGFFGCTENFEVPRNVHEESVHIDLI